MLDYAREYDCVKDCSFCIIKCSKFVVNSMTCMSYGVFDLCDDLGTCWCGYTVV